MPRPLCKDFDPETWFPFPTDEQTASQAKAVCSLCPLQDPCLRWALAFGVEFGIWGGLDETERRILRRRGLIGDPNAAHPIRDRRRVVEPA